MGMEPPKIRLSIEYVRKVNMHLFHVGDLSIVSLDSSHGL